MIVELVAFVGRPDGGDWEYVLWIPSSRRSWIVLAP